MKRAVTFWIVVLGFSLIAGLYVSCRDDVEVPLPPSINGNYTGIYRFVRIENGVDTNVDTSQLVEVRFRKPDFSMDIDGSIPEELRVFCDVIGTYELGNGVAITITDSNSTRGVCTQYWGPGGYFGFDYTTDTLKLLHDSSFVDNSGTSVRLVKNLRVRSVL